MIFPVLASFEQTSPGLLASGQFARNRIKGHSRTVPLSDSANEPRRVTPRWPPEAIAECVGLAPDQFDA